MYELPETKSIRLKDKLLTGDRVRKIYAISVIVSYAIILLWIIVFKCNNNEALHIQENLEKTLWERFTYRLEPFVDLRYLIRSGEFDSLETLAFLFNIVCFSFMSMFVSFVANDKWNIISLVALSIGVEVFQLFSGFGGFDPTDVFLNAIGAFLGCWLVKPIRKRASDTTINAILLALTSILGIWAIIVFIRTIIYFPI